VVVLPREARTISCLHIACCLLSFREWIHRPVCVHAYVCVCVCVFLPCPEKILILGSTLKQHRK